MTNVNDINVGDRVKATHKESGELVQGVAVRAGEAVVETKEFWLHGLDWNFEVLERALPELPKKNHAVVVDPEVLSPYIRMDGDWFSILFYSSPVQMSELAIQEGIRDDGWKVVFEGVDD